MNSVFEECQAGRLERGTQPLQQSSASFHHGRDHSHPLRQRPGSRNSLFRPFALPKPYTSPKDVFCLRETRVVNGYRRVSVFNHEIEVRNVPLREEVELHFTPNLAQQVMDVRIWWGQKMVILSVFLWQVHEFTFEL